MSILGLVFVVQWNWCNDFNSSSCCKITAEISQLAWWCFKNSKYIHSVLQFVFVSSTANCILSCTASNGSSITFVQRQTSWARNNSYQQSFSSQSTSKSKFCFIRVLSSTFEGSLESSLHYRVVWRNPSSRTPGKPEIEAFTYLNTTRSWHTCSFLANEAALPLKLRVLIYLLPL